MIGQWMSECGYIADINLNRSPTEQTAAALSSLLGSLFAIFHQGSGLVWNLIPNSSDTPLLIQLRCLLHRRLLKTWGWHKRDDLQEEHLQ